MIIYFDNKKLLFVISFFILTNISVLSQNIDLFEIYVPFQNNTLSLDENGMINNLTGKNIREISESLLFGKFIDIYFPCKILNFYIFIFKKDGITFRIAANTELTIDTNILLDEIELEKFIAIGYYSFDYPDGKNKKMFNSSTNTPFDYLNDIKPEEYISIAEIERIVGVELKENKIEKTAFYSPFYYYYYHLENAFLMLMGSPSDDKNESYYMGGWSYWEK